MLASVLINNYNYGRYLEHCIESVLQQTYREIEIIVYDDGSTDGSLDVLNKYKDQITLIQKVNYGKTPNINQMNAVHQAFLKSNGDVIFLLDSDDAFHNRKIEEVMNVLYEYPNIDTVQHPMSEMDGEGQVLDVVRPVIKQVTNYINYIASTSSLFHLFVPTSGLVFRRSLLEKLLPLKEDNLSTICVDTRLMLHSALIGKIKTLNEPYAYYRIHGSNTFKKINEAKVYQQYTNELYQFFNVISQECGHKEIEFNMNQYLENTFFYSLIDVEKNIQFLKNDSLVGECWIWGAGEAGQSIYYSLTNEGQTIEGFIDTNPQKKNTTVLGRKVLSPEEMVFSTKTKILVSPYYAYEQIAEYLKSIGLTEGINYSYPYKKEHSF